MTILYNTLMRLYLLGAALASPFSEKASLFYKGRKNLLRLIDQVMFKKAKDNKIKVWFHCASVGEFEQARPLIEKLKKEYSGVSVVVTFFSPSGYELRKNYPFADFVFYLPMDTKGNAIRFIESVNPCCAIFIKYEFWKNYLSVLQKRGIPTYLVSGIFRRNQIFFKPWGASFRNILKSFSHFYLQDTSSQNLLKEIGFVNSTVSGDTRFDRVFEITQTEIDIRGLNLFAKNGVCCVAGSTWSPDEQLLVAFIKESSPLFKFVIAPHETDVQHIEKLESMLEGIKFIRYSETDSCPSADITDASVFILDTVGLLSIAYRYGRFAYVGGGFGKGIHNILEAATYGLPVVFGPNYQKFKEARDLIELGGAFSVNNSVSEVSSLFDSLFAEGNFYDNSSLVCREYVQKNLGATDNILKSIAPVFNNNS